MVEARRSYRPAALEPQPRGQEKRAEPQTAPKKEWKPSANTSGKTKFVTITGLFMSKSGKSDTVFVTPAIAEAFKNIQPGDTVGVSKNTKNDNLSLWYIEGDGTTGEAA